MQVRAYPGIEVSVEIFVIKISGVQIFETRRENPLIFKSFHVLLENV